MTLISLVIGQCSGKAEEPIKLALVSHSPAPSTNAVKVAAKVSTADTNSFSASFRQHPVTTSLPITAAGRSADNASTVVPVPELIKKRPAPGGLFSGQPGNGNFGFANIEAGYGQAYDCDSVVLRGHNGTAYEETRYIFFKKVVKF